MQSLAVRTSSTAEAVEMVDSNCFEGDPSAWQQKNETILEFLRRAPVGNPASAILGPWLWVGCPWIPATWMARMQKTDVPAFTEAGEALLHAHEVQKVNLEQADPKAAPATITRRLGPYREQLEDDLLTLAVKTGTTYGKWMLFPDVWGLVAEATAAGKLGPTSKAATSPGNLICVYTYAFEDNDDVRRVLEALHDLGVCSRDGKPIYYKCDAYTYLGLDSNNK